MTASHALRAPFLSFLNRRAVRALCLLPAAALLSGCVIAVDADDDDDGWNDDWRDQQAANLDAIADLRLGLTRSSIEAEMGRPDLVEAFVRDDAEYIVLRYRTQRRHGDGETTRDETTPLVFVDGELVGWGEAAIEHATVGSDD